MSKKSTKTRNLTTVVNRFQSEKEILTTPEIGLAYKATLTDFVHGKTTRASCDTISKLLKGALETRRLAITEKGGRAPQHF